LKRKHSEEIKKKRTVITRRDAFEQEIDIIQELGEQRIAQNQKVLADDTKSIAERREALRKNNEQKKRFSKKVLKDTRNKVLNQ
jgi:hypothetical protein